MDLGGAVQTAGVRSDRERHASAHNERTNIVVVARDRRVGVDGPVEAAVVAAAE
jgi:hypothetical protein